MAVLAGLSRPPLEAGLGCVCCAVSGSRACMAWESAGLFAHCEAVVFEGGGLAVLAGLSRPPLEAGLGCCCCAVCGSRACMAWESAGLFANCEAVVFEGGGLAVLAGLSRPPLEAGLGCCCFAVSGSRACMACKRCCPCNRPPNKNPSHRLFGLSVCGSGGRGLSCGSCLVTTVTTRDFGTSCTRGRLGAASTGALSGLLGRPQRGRFSGGSSRVKLRAGGLVGRGACTSCPVFNGTGHERYWSFLCAT